MAFQIVKLLDAVQLVNILGGLSPQGAYNASTNYAVGDSVSYNGSSYVMYIDAPANTVPTDTDYWMVVASKGDTGAAGADGADGAQGPQGLKGDKGDQGDPGTEAILTGMLTPVAVAPSADATLGIFYILNDGVSKSLCFKYPNDEDPVVFDERLL